MNTETTTAHPKHSAMIMVHECSSEFRQLCVSPVQTHTIAPFEFAIAADGLYRASYVDTPPAQMIWKKQKSTQRKQKRIMRLVTSLTKH